MQKTITLITCLLLLVFFQQYAYPQCSTSPCVIPVPAVNAMDACILPNPGALDCYFGATTPDAPQSFPPYWCSAIHNNHWFAFTADAATATFEISTYGCAVGNGIQAAVLSTTDCINFAFVSPCLGNIPSGTTQTLVASGLTPGEVYYICIDGSGGAQCDYSINGANPTITGNTSGICIPSSATSTFTTSSVSVWTINPSSAGSIVGNSTSNQVTVIWTEPGPAEVCAQSLNCPNAPVECIPVNVGEDSEGFETVDLCQGKSVQCAGRTFTSPGTFPVILNANSGCDSVVNCIVNLIPTVITNETVLLCQGQSATCAGQEFYNPGTFPVTLTGPQGCDSIVRCMIQLVPTSIPPTQFVTLCGPAQYPVCDNVYDETGIYSEICTGHLGCDSIVNLNLAVLQPNAVIAPPAVLDCDSNLIITLNGSQSSVNNASGGVTLYQWNGPGIVGFGNQSTVQVNEPGTYCLVVRHGRAGIYCADTACVTVTQNSGLPQKPVLAGDLNPCAGTAIVYTATATGNPPPSSYTWTTPNNHPYTAVPPSSIQVVWNSAGPLGPLCVSATNACGSSSPTCLPVSVQELPLAPQFAGPDSVCADAGTFLFALDSFVVGTVYSWTVPSGAVLSGGADSVLIDFKNAVSGQVCVTALNSCDTTAPVCQTVQVLPTPTADLDGMEEICAGETVTLTFALTGNPPFDVNWTDGNQHFTLSNISNGHSVIVNPTQSTTYRLLNVQDNSDPACATTVSDSVTVTVWQAASVSQTLQICQGETVTLGGAVQSASGLYFDTLSTVHGCDSVIASTLVVNAIDTLAVFLTTCDPAAAGVTVQNLNQINGCDSIVITTVTALPSDSILLFDKSCDPVQAGVFTFNLTNQYGCDSIVVSTVTYSQSDTTLLSAETCDKTAVGIFTQNLVSSEGCDSVLITTVTLIPGDTTYVSQLDCNPANTGVFSQTIANIAGCDSAIITTVSLFLLDTTYLGGSTCNQAAAGVFSQTLQTLAGCDSVLITTVDLFLLDTTYLDATTCDPAAAGIFAQTLLTPQGCDSVLVTTVTELPKDTTYLFLQDCDPANAGVFTEIRTNQYGCDSLVITTVALLNSDTTLIALQDCNPANTGVFIENHFNQNGCDSTVITTVTLLPSSTTLIDEQDCNPANVGIFVNTLVNQYGCDSTVILTVSFSQIDTTLLAASTCDPAAAGIFTEHLVTPGGCDSTVITAVSLLPSNETFLQSTTCDPLAAGVFTAMLTNQYGCDSIVTETVALLPSSSTLVEISTCDPTQVGTKTAVLPNQWGCDSTVTTVTTLRPPSACGTALSVAGSTIPCKENTGTLTITATLGEAPFTYTIALNGTPVNSGTIAAAGVPQTVGGLSAGNYTVTLSSPNGFTAAAAATVVQLFAPQIAVNAVSNFSGFGISCAGATDGSARATASGGAPPYTYNWSTGSTDALSNDLGAGTYAVTVTDANTCTDSGVVTLSEPAELRFAFQVSDLDCFGTRDGKIVAQPEGGAAPYRYVLNNGAPQQSNTFAGLTAGTYTVTVFDANDCQTSEIIIVTAPEPLTVDLGQDQTIGLGESAVLEAVVNAPYDSLASVLWTPMPDSSECPECLTQTVTPLITTAYSVSVVANNGCRDEDKLLVIVDRRKYIYVPNVFTPDGSSENNAVTVFGNPAVVRNIKQFQIFNRWGEQVFLAENFAPNNLNAGWNGAFRGQPMNPGVFAWYVEVEFIDGVTEVFQGDVTVIR